MQTPLERLHKRLRREMEAWALDEFGFEMSSRPSIMETSMTNSVQFGGEVMYQDEFRAIRKAVVTVEVNIRGVSDSDA